LGSRNPKMDIQRKNVGRRKVVRWTIAIVLTVGILIGGTVAVKQLKPAAPSVEMSTLWPDQVKRGPMVLDVRGLGTLVPEDTLLITATTDGRIERILVKPGADVKPDTIVMIMSNPQLETQLVSAEFTMKGAQADYDNLKVTLQKQLLDLQSQAAQMAADLNNAKNLAERDATLLKDGLASTIDAKISAEKVKALEEQYKLMQQRININSQSDQAQLAASQVKVDQLKSEYQLKKDQVEQLKVRARFAGRLEAPSATANPVEEGQNVTAGTALDKVAQPTHLKAELKIAETQVKDITIGLPAEIDTRLAGGGSDGKIQGRVSRIDSSVLNGTVTVDVALLGALPPGSRPDLSVDGTIQLMKLDNAVYVGRPVFGQQDQQARLFKIDPDGKYATAVKVMFGRSSVNQIEIKSGLNVGDRVILSDMSAYDAYDRIKLN